MLRRREEGGGESGIDVCLSNLSFPCALLVGTCTKMRGRKCGSTAAQQKCALPSFFTFFSFFFFSPFFFNSHLVLLCLFALLLFPSLSKGPNFWLLGGIIY